MFIYVDDVYIASSNPDALDEFTSTLRSHFELKILGTPRQLLGIQIQWGADFKAVHLSASKLIKELIDDHKLKEEDIRATPMETTYRPTKANSPSEEEQKTSEMKKLKLNFQELVGSFIFIMNTCRPDISYSVSQLCRRMANPSKNDWTAAMNVLHYLHGTPTLGIGYRHSGNRTPYLYVDSDDGADETRKSSAGYMTMLADGPLYWKSAMVEAYSLSSCESEIRAINMALEPIKEAIKIKQWLQDIDTSLHFATRLCPYPFLVDHPLEILEDNTACIDWGNSHVNSTRLKHLERDLKWIQEEVQKKTIQLVYIPTRSQLADIYTKPLPRDLFLSLRNSFMFSFQYAE
jgi:hypothetical protein